MEIAEGVLSGLKGRAGSVHGARGGWERTLNLLYIRVDRDIIVSQTYP